MDPRDQVIEAARQVALNAFGTTPRHTRARDGGCRDDCIPCGMTALEAALAALDAAAPAPLRRQVQQARDIHYEQACEHGEMPGHEVQEAHESGRVSAYDEVLALLAAPEGE